MKQFTQYIKESDNTSYYDTIDDVILTIFDDFVRKYDLEYNIVPLRLKKYSIEFDDLGYLKMGRPDESKYVDEFKRLIELFKKRLSNYDMIVELEGEFDDEVILTISTSDTKLELSRILTSKVFPNDKYFVYDLSDDEVHLLLNKWFVGESHEKGSYYHNTLRFWTVKQVDSETGSYLYNEHYHPFSITFYHTNNDIYDMKVQLWSYDNSSFSFWLHPNKSDMTKYKDLVVNWVSEHDVLNGFKLIEFGKSIGSTEIDRD